MNKVRGEGRLQKPQVATNVILALVALFYLLPLWYALNNAFKYAESISVQPFWLTKHSFTFENIARAYEQLHFKTAFFNSALILALSLLLLVTLGSLAAYGVILPNNRAIRRLYTFFVALISVPPQITIVPLLLLLKRLDLVNSFLGVAFVYAGMYLPFVIFLYAGFMRSIPKEIVESASIDGCGPLKTYIHIYMPLLKTITGIVLVIRGVSIWNDLLVPLIVLNKNAMFTLPLQLYIFSSSKVGQWDLVFGGTVLVCLPITVFFLAFQKSFVKGVMAGSLKG
ncbi:carbohydrate ABC transporter permease [Paenibacillus sacheonensis]|uniref:ABC transporter permease subunit n=1 Tax=Paenibacillus sacheonensis TaxID=742054 RepID=A0A7X4YRN5_9BACL|nr:carbohydrate ABC transporter permease [Paenibacillus sacheonensis]MBM7567580.1 raffinose/stachyose/melibiose transport system permease protein [Paenibacillus sacheonensis]NBC71317.1 ABC transporter permease subunit [Paenibacillus sacheonensis]